MPGYNRILLFFILLIIIPGTLLGVLAFRGIINDQAIIEREKIKSLESEENLVIQFIRNKLDSAKISTTGSSLNNEMLNHRNNKLIHNILLYSENGTQWLLPSNDVNLPTSFITPPYYPEGTQLEFQKKDYNKAIKFYQSKYSEAQDPLAKAQISQIIARLFVKAGQLSSAIDAYNKICNAYPDIVTFGSIPTCWIAKMEMIKLDLKENKDKGAQLVATSLLNDMFTSPGQADWKDYEYFSERTLQLIDELINSLTNKRLPLQDLVILRDQFLIKDSIDHYLVDFRSNLDLLIPFPQKQERVYKEIEGRSYLFESILEDGKPMIIVYDYLRLKEFLNSYPNHRPDIESFGLISFEQDLEITRTDQLSNIFTLPDDLPPFKISISAPNSTLWLGFVDSKSSFFVYVLAFVLLLLGLGLYLIIKTIRVEIQLSRMKSDFIASVSHEFKSPITAIRQLSERLENQKVNSEERKHEYYKALHSQSIRLSHLVDNILDFAKLESGEEYFTFEEKDLNKVVESISERFKAGLVNQDFPVELRKSDPPLIVKIDENAIAQVIENLLDNAYKYARTTKGVVISLKNDKNEALLSIRDFGPGINKADQPKIFDRFYRVNNDSFAAVKGSGIGLALVKKIVEGHKGEINIKSTIHEGSEFIISLPKSLSV